MESIVVIETIGYKGNSNLLALCKSETNIEVCLEANKEQVFSFVGTEKTIKEITEYIKARGSLMTLGGGIRAYRQEVFE